MQSNKTCQLLEQYLGYLIVIKGRSQNTILEYRCDILNFFKFILESKNITIPDNSFCFADINFIRAITLTDMYAFITYSQNNLHSSAGTRARKIVSIRQFWKYLKTNTWSRKCCYNRNLYTY